MSAAGEGAGLTLFVSGASPVSARAVRRIRDICARHFPGGYELEIIDIYDEPEFLAGGPVIASPTLVHTSAGRTRVLVGDLGDEDRVLELLGLEHEAIAAETDE